MSITPIFRNYHTFNRLIRIITPLILCRIPTLKKKTLLCNRTLQCICPKIEKSFKNDHQQKRYYSSEKITSTDKEVTIILDLKKKFKIKELNVVITGNVIIVEGLKEEKIEDSKSTFSYFMKQYLLSDDHDLEKVKTTYLKDGSLKITAPKKSGNSKTNKETVQTIKLGPPKIIEIKEE